MAGASAPAHAHALLTASAPADGASVEQPPAHALLTFTEPLDPLLSRVCLLDASGTEVELGETEALAGPPAQLRVGLGQLSQGTYTMAWRTTSLLDGHTTTGSVAFGVGVHAVAVGTEGAQAVEGAPVPTVASVAGRWLFYVGVVLMLGAAVVGLVVFWACLRPSRFALALVGGGASAATLVRALSGHANASSVRWFTVGMQWVHLVSVAAWVGGLVWLLVAMRRGDPGQGPGLARRFSSVAVGTLAVVAVSGSVRALDEVGSWARLVDTAFGVTLLVKVGFFTALVALGARSRFRHVRAPSPGRVGGLPRVVKGEVAIAAGVLGVTAVLAGQPDPSYSVTVESDPSPPVTEGTPSTSLCARTVKP